MKKIFSITVIFAVIMMASINLLAQNVIADKDKVNELTEKIKEHTIQINRLNNELGDLIDYSAAIRRVNEKIDSLNRNTPPTAYAEKVRDRSLKALTGELQRLNKKQSRFISSSWKRVQRDTLIARVARYEKQRNRIYEGYIASDKPIEMKSKEVKRRDNARKVRISDHKEAVQNKWDDANWDRMSASPVKADSILGYEGFVVNLSRSSRITFVIYAVDVDGNVSTSEKISFFTSPGERITYHLLPGKYRCSFVKEGVKIGFWDFEVSPRLQYVLGTQTHWALWREGM